MSNLYRSTYFNIHIHHMYHNIDIYLIGILLFDEIHDHLGENHRFELSMVLSS